MKKRRAENSFDDHIRNNRTSIDWCTRNLYLREITV